MRAYIRRVGTNGHTCSGSGLTTRISMSLPVLSARGTGSPGLASSRALPTSVVGITASRCDDDLDGGAKGEGETEEDADATGGGFCGSVDTGDLGWWEGKKPLSTKNRVCAGIR